MKGNILIVGVGGQGTLLASKLMGKVYAGRGLDVKVSEVHGMSQRGGSVVTYVRYGDKVWSSLIDKGQADVIVSFEQLEAARWLEYLKPDGKIITNTKKIDPMPVIMGAVTYPADVLEKLRSLVPDLTAVDADALAQQAGSARATNLVLLGVFAKSSGIDKAVWLDAIRSTVPPKTVEVNEKAFELGFAI